MDTLIRGYSAYQKPKPPTEVTFTVRYFTPKQPDPNNTTCPPYDGAWPLVELVSYTRTLSNLSPGQIVSYNTGKIINDLMVDIDKCEVDYNGEVIEFPAPQIRYTDPIAGLECYAYEHVNAEGQSIYLPQTKAASDGVQFTVYNIFSGKPVVNFNWWMYESTTVKIPEK